MLRFNPSWFARILRNVNSEPEVHVTVIENPVNPEPVADPVSDAVEDAARIAALANSMGKADPELLRRLDSIEDRQRFIVDQLGLLVTKTGIIETNTTVAAIAEVVEEIEEEILPEVPIETPVEQIPQTPPVVPEEPKKRGRRWI